MGSRIDVAILDDCVTFRNALTVTGRKRTKDWFLGTLIGRMSPRGRVLGLNNAWHDEDLWHELEREYGEVYRVVRYEAGTPECDVPWWTKARLLERLAEVGEIEYARQMLNVPLSASTGLLPIDSIRRCQALWADPESWWGGGYGDAMRFTTAGVDLGGSDSALASLTSIAVCGIGQDDAKHLLHLRSGNWLGLELIRQLIEVHRQHRPREWVVETNGVQLHLGKLLRDPVILQAAGSTPEEAGSIRVLGHNTTQSSKQEAMWGIRAMGTDFDASRWRLPRQRREVEELVREMQRYSLTDHTGDRLMAFWLADRRLKGASGIFHLRVSSR